MEDTTSHQGNTESGTTWTDSNHDRELKKQRLSAFQAQIEAELQQNISEAARIRQQITTAKTDYKRQFYEKKFSKVSKSVRHGVATIQQISQLQAEYEKDDTSAAS